MGSDDRYAACFLLPAHGTAACMASVVDGLVVGMEEVWRLGSTAVNVLCPRFTAEQDLSLTAALRDLGMSTAFGGDARLGRMCADGAVVKVGVAKN